MLEAPQISKEVDRDSDTYHITDIVVADKRQGQEHDKYFILAILDQLLNAVHNQREPDDSIDPHGVILLRNAVGHQGVHNRECNNAYAIDAFFGLMQVERHGRCTKRSFHHEHKQKRLAHSVLGEQAYKI